MTHNAAPAPPVSVSILVAMGENRAIGKDNKLLWHIPEDLKRFKSLTLGKPVIMGRKTFDSILDQLGKALPGRANIVVSRQSPPFPLPEGRGIKGEGDLASASPFLSTTPLSPASSAASTQPPSDLHYVKSIEEGIKLAAELAGQNGHNEIFIIGGAQIYEQALKNNLADRIYLTRVHRSYDADAFFPELDTHLWHVTSEDPRPGDPGFSFVVLERRG